MHLISLSISAVFMALMLSWAGLLLCVLSSVSGKNNCPDTCNCSEDSTLEGTVVNCSARKLIRVPNDLPSTTVSLQLDKNVLNRVIISLAKLPNLKVLSLKSCNLLSLELIWDLKEKGRSESPSLQVLDLSDNTLQDVPEGLPESLRTLQLSYNNLTSLNIAPLLPIKKLEELFVNHNSLTEINADVFKASDLADITCLRSLRKLALNGNSIRIIWPLAFADLESLVALTLANNDLSSLSVDTFAGLWNLQHLDLNENHLQLVENDTFKNLESLRDLDLNSNLLKTVPFGLPMLEWLDLSANQIHRVFEKESKVDLYPTEVFSLARNPLHCDCELLWLKELYGRRETVFRHMSKSPNELTPSCASPLHLHGESWDILGDEVFRCGEGFQEEPNVLSAMVPPAVDENDAVPGLFRVRRGLTTDTTIEIHWKLEGPQTFTYLYIQHYAFGMRDKTTKYSLVSLKDRRHLVENLRPESNYVVCAIPKTNNIEPEQLSPLSLNHCLEVATKEPPPVLIMSYLTVFGYYLVGMLATVIIVFCCIGVLALVYGVISARHSTWAAKEVQIDAPQEMSTFSASLQNAAMGQGKPHED